MSSKDLANTLTLLRQHQQQVDTSLPRISLLGTTDVRELVRARLGKTLTDEELTPYLALARDLEALILTRQANIRAQGGSTSADLEAMLRNPAIAYIGRLVDSQVPHD